MAEGRYEVMRSRRSDAGEVDCDRILCRTFSHTNTFSLANSLYLSLSHPHTHSLTHSTHTHSLSLSHVHTYSLSQHAYTQLRCECLATLSDSIKHKTHERKFSYLAATLCILNRFYTRLSIAQILIYQHNSQIAAD